MKKEPKMTRYAKHRHEVEVLEREIEFNKGKISLLFEMISQMDGAGAKGILLTKEAMVQRQHEFLEEIERLETDILNRYLKFSESPKHWSNKGE